VIVDAVMIGASGGCGNGYCIVVVVAARLVDIGRVLSGGVHVLGVDVMAAPWLRHCAISTRDAIFLATYKAYVSDGRLA
jgi:hypothetical protein